MEKIICNCGHENPVGTKLCEKCGRPLTEEIKEQKVVDMRYDGTAIRSKTYNKSVIDKIWNFFSSVKVGVALIVITLIAASVGTIFPQEFNLKAASEVERIAYYEDTFGFLGKVYYALGLSNLYNAWWFQILIGMLAISIIVASLDRGLPLHRSLKNQRVKRHESFMKRQRIIAEGAITEGDSSRTLDLIQEKMRKMRYKVRREENALLAERGRFSRYGPYINHLGLILFLLGVMLRLVPGFYEDEAIWVSEGETRAIPGMEGYFIKNNKFILETHENSPNGSKLEQGVNVMAKNYQSNVTLYKQAENTIAGQENNLQVVKDYSIRVNHPLKYDGYSIYQMDYQLNQLKQMNFELTNKATGESLGTVEIDLTNPKDEYVLNDNSKVQLLSYFPDFSGFKDGAPQTASPNPNNPAFIFKMITPETPKGEVSFVAIRQTVEPQGKNAYKMEFSNVETRNKSGLTVRKDKTYPFLILGGIIFMLGVVIGSYWNHRRVWVEQLEDGTIRLAAHTNKNWFGMKKDINAVTEYAHLPKFIDQLEIDVKEKKEGDNTL